MYKAIFLGAPCPSTSLQRSAKTAHLAELVPNFETQTHPEPGKPVLSQNR